MSPRRRDIQFSPIESAPTDASFASLSPQQEREENTRVAVEIGSPRSSDVPSREMSISPARAKAVELAGSLGMSPASEKDPLPPMPEHLESFPTPRKEFESYMEKMRERAENGHEIRARDLIATFESYHARDLDRDEALREMDGLTEKLKKVRERHGDKRMAQALTKRIYSRRYHLQQNSMLGLFTKPERGNCSATAKGITTILEEVGLDPRTEIGHQMFSDHVRAVAKINGEWYVLEGGVKRLRSKDLEGTTIISLEDEKRGLLGLQPSSPIELGEKDFHQPDGGIFNRGIFKWMKDGLARADQFVGRLTPPKIPSTHQEHGLRPLATAGLTNIESLLGTLSPLNERNTRRVAAMLAALSFVYAVGRYQDPNVETMEELSEAIKKDVDTMKDTTGAVASEVARVAKDTLGELKDSLTLNPNRTRRRPKEVTREGSAPAIQGLSERQMTEVERRMERYYGIAHYLLAGEEHLTETPEGFRLDIQAQPEAETISPDLWRYFIKWGYGDRAEGLPNHFIVNINGENLEATDEGREVWLDAWRNINDFRPGREGTEREPFPSHLEFHVNGETLVILPRDNQLDEPTPNVNENETGDIETSEVTESDLHRRLQILAVEVNDASDRNLINIRTHTELGELIDRAFETLASQTTDDLVTSIETDFRTALDTGERLGLGQSTREIPDENIASSIENLRTRVYESRNWITPEDYSRFLWQLVLAETSARGTNPNTEVLSQSLQDLELEFKTSEEAHLASTPETPVAPEILYHVPELQLQYDGFETYRQTFEFAPNARFDPDTWKGLFSQIAELSKQHHAVAPETEQAAFRITLKGKDIAYTPHDLATAYREIYAQGQNANILDDTTIALTFVNPIFEEGFDRSGELHWLAMSPNTLIDTNEEFKP